jgi:hypothetical protein
MSKPRPEHIASGNSKEDPAESADSTGIKELNFGAGGGSWAESEELSNVIV